MGNNQKNQNISCVSDLDIKLSGPEMVILSMPINISSFFDNTKYCSMQVVREISGYTRNFRVLALSATPGDNPEVNNHIQYFFLDIFNI